MGASHLLTFFAPPARSGGPRLRIHVIYTTAEAMQAGLSAAAVLALDLDATIEVLVPHIVPFPLPLHSPDSEMAVTEQKLKQLVQQTGVEASITVLLCRDREETIPAWLPAQSIAVLARKRTWGPGSLRPLIRAIQEQGHQVIVVDSRTAPAATPALCKTSRRER